jgi:hypothetical protein
MATYAAYQFTAQDEEGNVVAGAKVEIRSEVDNTLVTLYGARDGSGAAPGNPATTDADGFVRVYLEGGRYRVRIYTGSSATPTSEQILRDVAIGTAAEYDRDDLLTVDEPALVTGASATIAAGTMSVVVQRTAPAATALALPPVASQKVPLKISDDSTSVTDHQITLTPDGSEKIMNQSSWVLYSTDSSLAGVTLIPSTTLNGWYIAP